MTIPQLDYPIIRMNAADRPGATFTLPYPVAKLIANIAKRSVSVLPGQSNLPWQIDLPTIPDVVAFFDLLTSDTNGHKLKLPGNSRTLLIKLLNRSALNLQGKAIYGSYTAALPSGSSAAGSSPAGSSAASSSAASSPAASSPAASSPAASSPAASSPADSSPADSSPAAGKSTAGGPLLGGPLSGSSPIG